MRYSSFLFVIVLFASVSSAAANDRSEIYNQELSEGMTYGEVLGAWGAPEEKIEQEAKRMDIWVYDESRVRFFEGRLMDIQSTSHEPINAKAEGTTTTQREAAPDVAVADILNEIMDSN